MENLKKNSPFSLVFDSAEFQNIISAKDGMSTLFITIWLIFGVGVALFFLGFLGFYGSKNESRCLLALYFFLIFVIQVVEVVAGVMSYIFYPEVKSAALDSTHLYGQQEVVQNFSSFSPEEKALTKDVTEYWDTFQATFKCCGYDQVEDWNNTTYFTVTNKYPASCCGKGSFQEIFENNNVVNGSCSMAEVEAVTNHDSCTDRIENNIVILGGVGLGVLVVELLAMLASCCMYRSLQDDF